MNQILSHYVEIITDPAHSLVEFTFVLLDVLVIDAVRRRLKRHFHNDLDDEHRRLDDEHGVTHHGQVTRPVPAVLHEDGTLWVGNRQIQIHTQEAARG
jgi:hypothetical protein